MTPHDVNDVDALVWFESLDPELVIAASRTIGECIIKPFAAGQTLGLYLRTASLIFLHRQFEAELLR